MIVILGGGGVVGSAFVRACQAQGLDHQVVTRANYDEHVGTPCDLLVNANGNSSKLLAERSPLEEFDRTVRSVRRSLVDFSPGLYVHISSCDVYADCSSPGTTGERQVIATDDLSVYGFHKYLAELCVRRDARKWLIFRLGGVVGPGLYKNAVYDILSGGPLWLDPESRLQYLHTDDVTRIVFEIVHQGHENSVFNLCGRGTVRLADVVELTGRPIAIQPGAPRIFYDVDSEAVSRVVGVPRTEDTVFGFVRRHLAENA